MSARVVDVGDGVSIRIDQVRGAADGPTVALLGGVHGDELEGILAVRTLLDRIGGSRGAGGLGSGRVLAVQVANPPAHDAMSRTSPLDGANLARVFPGSPSGTVTERIADALAHHVIARADLLVDLHSAGAHYAMPFFAGYGDPAAADDTYAFGAPLVWVHEGLNPGRSLTTAAEHGVAALYVEGSGGGGLRRSEVDGYVDGVLRLLGRRGMVDDPPPAGVVRRVVRGGDGDVDSSVSADVAGWCVTAVRAGDVVGAGDPVAEIVDGRGRVAQRVTAPHDGVVMMLRRSAPVVEGTGIVMLGPVPEELP
ncbi:M14 family metallopeptidase [Luedemannella helvata]|uniref:succinylglutamate desuccinylase/aspartoacylase family protein n=1 Tax=Luedemannella helvata TaxID=349315 RepID=UPI0031CECDBF